MTREEALEILEHNWTRLVNADYSDKELGESLNVAIEALEQEPKEGHWYNPLSESGYFCTNCESNSDFMYPYCPHCGARMGGD